MQTACFSFTLRIHSIPNSPFIDPFNIEYVRICAREYNATATLYLIALIRQTFVYPTHDDFSWCVSNWYVPRSIIKMSLTSVFLECHISLEMPLPFAKTQTIWLLLCFSSIPFSTSHYIFFLSLSYIRLFVLFLLKHAAVAHS